MHPRKRTGPRTYIWQLPGWPAMRFDPAALAGDLDHARLEQGRLMGQIAAIGLHQPLQAGCAEEELWTRDAVATAAIEGQSLDLRSVRSSVARRLGLDDAPTHDRHVDGLVEVMQDASAGHARDLDEDRLCRWQAALFPGGTAGIRRIAVGRWRDHADPMQIVSGLPGREVVHYTAPASADVAAQMGIFLAWFNATRPGAAEVPAAYRPHGLVRAALAHLWFESIHPFEDGNGRLGRAVVDMALAQDIGSSARVFSLSRQLLDERAAYYEALNRAQTGELDVTPWVRWFVQAFTAGCLQSQQVVRQAMDKAAFWQGAARFALNERQRRVLQRLADAGDGGFLGGMTAEKYSKITGASKATATRDLTDLARDDLLVVTGVGKATRYAIAIKGWNPGAPA